ncbi:FAD-binding 8 [Lasiodiplodia theobromae]|uniref:Superoxide-generating NADPH oxidase heavy chain subunit B n=1 Tax=Lasiodiplodia theobromae TaxID=45133 RepID=A0A5N5DSI9_9PEZI|nr:FAD-binding 8 [Lasiodiplodia theobromae]KAB2580925.1 Superoxide-generating NADPH oxidase heavy chain subunit B [Lasiodiplodia theobromae]KAF4542398.1 FAD-binding 8 [Lasiodiplodia theobromae]KAF9635860.1 FAD-binding 8 [Lasiodiplodia theobromae]
MAAQRSWKSHFIPRKLLFYFIFHGLHVFLFAFGWYKQAADDRLAALNGLKFSVWISRGAGLVLSFDVLFILLPMCRTLLRVIRPKIRWLPLDESQWFHRQVAYAMLFWTCWHVLAHYVNFFNVEKTQVRPELALQIHYTQAGGITGHVMLLCMLLIYTTAHHRVRQQSFETFWYTHHLFIPFLLGMYTHATGCFVRDSVEPFSPFAGANFWNHCIGYQGWRWELWGGGIYLFERLYREVRARRDTRIVKVVKHPYDAVEIQFTKPSMRYKPGQWLFINCPSVSGYQWHPFTITSCPYDPYISIHVRQVGDFTRALADALGAGPAQAKLYDDMDPNGMYEIALQHGQEMPAIRIDGPYGAPAEDVFDNEIAVLIGTGIGVTPWASILKNIWHMRLSPNPPKRLRRVEFIWVCKDTSSFEWFQALLSSLEAQSLGSSDPNGQEDFLRIHTYLTQKVDVDTANNIVLNSVGTDKDPLTELKSRTNFGRPDFTKLLVGMRDGIMTRSYMSGLESSLRTDVGVYFCGPSVAARDINKACKAATCPDVRFRFWKEHF